jgi:hypothetical protein
MAIGDQNISLTESLSLRGAYLQSPLYPQVKKTLSQNKLFIDFFSDRMNLSDTLHLGLTEITGAILKKNQLFKPHIAPTTNRNPGIDFNFWLTWLDGNNPVDKTREDILECLQKEPIEFFVNW